MTADKASTSTCSAELSVVEDAHACRISVAGDWQIAGNQPDRSALRERLQALRAGKTVHIEAPKLGKWDSSLLTLLVEIRRATEESGNPLDLSELPEGVSALIDLAFAVKEREGARRVKQHESMLERIGKATLETWGNIVDLVEFTGELILSIRRLFSRKAVVQPSQVWLAIQEAGAEALPIVGLISFLIGMIFAFVGVMQLSNFGAGIYTADLVAVAMVREMAPIMTGILMAGRTGASYAAQLGTMKVNEEIDALTTLGINPIDFLVLPKFIALIIMMPFLTMYASALGIIGGMTVSMSMLDVNLTQYVNQTNNALTFNTLWGGLFKAIIYGALVALAGTQQGMACGSSAMAVGVATTKAVVSGIVLIVVSASILTVIYVNIGI